MSSIHWGIIQSSMSQKLDKDFVPDQSKIGPRLIHNWSNISSITSRLIHDWPRSDPRLIHDWFRSDPRLIHDWSRNDPILIKDWSKIDPKLQNWSRVDPGPIQVNQRLFQDWSISLRLVNPLKFLEYEKLIQELFMMPILKITIPKLLGHLVFCASFSRLSWEGLWAISLNVMLSLEALKERASEKPAF